MKKILLLYICLISVVLVCQQDIVNNGFTDINEKGTYTGSQNEINNAYQNEDTVISSQNANEDAVASRQNTNEDAVKSRQNANVDAVISSNSVNKNYPKVYHLFTHALIAYPDIAFDKNNEMAVHYDKDCLTVNEFSKILEELYRNNFILVSPDDMYSVINGKVKRKPWSLDKKPLILSFDDINYYTKKMNKGMNDKIIISNGKLATYTANAINKVNYNNEVITILENFVNKHNDFSFNNAKGTICLTGFDGILGYRTQKKSVNRQEEIKRVKPIIAKLKNNGWRFACHSYGHYHIKDISYDKFKEDTLSWLDEVGSLVGKTDIYCFPYGENEVSVGNELSNKQKLLNDLGFKMFWGVGDREFWGELPFGKIYPKVSFMDRIDLDGFSLRHKNLGEYFDADAVIDTVRPKISYK